MKEQLITEITRKMLPYLDNSQMEQLQEVLTHCFWGVQISPSSEEERLQEKETNKELLEMFISAKRVEGCSEKTLKYYNTTILRMFTAIKLHVTHIRTDDLRNYLSEYQQASQCSKGNIDNIRRILSSFFAWLEDESYIIKSPVRRIHKIKSSTTVKETYSDESLEIMRDQCGCLRDLALIDLLASTGMRVGELVRLNRADIDFENRECVVFGKGSKERPVYFDARTKIHLKNYLDSRTDENPALFVSLMRPFNRLEISGVEIRLRELGRRLTKANLLQIEIRVPDMDIQQNIVSVLDKICYLIELRQKELYNLDQLVKSRFIEMFGDPVDNPHGFRKVALSELAEIRIGPFGSLLHKEDYIEGGHPLLNPSHIVDGKVAPDSKLTISDKKYDELEAYHLHTGDVVMGRRGEMGRCAVVPSEGFLCGTGSLLIRTKGEVTADYIQKTISFPSFRKTIEDMAVGQTMPNLNVPIVSKFQIIKPPIEVQINYYKFVAQTDKSKYRQEKCIGFFQCLEKSIRQEWL